MRTQADVSGVDLTELSQLAHYQGSVEHKNYPSPAGPPALRSDATRCPKYDLDTIESWLREAMQKGSVGTPWEGRFPRYVWVTNTEGSFEGRLTNRDQGTYKGYPLLPEERPSWLE